MKRQERVVLSAAGVVGLPLMIILSLGLELGAGLNRASHLRLGVAHAQGAGMMAEWDDYRRAIDAYDEGISAQRRGSTAQAMSSFARADTLFRQVLQQNPHRTDVYAPLGDILIRKGQHTQAYVLLSEKVRAGVNDPKVKWQLARALHGIHQGRKALEVAQQVVAAEPDNTEALGFVAERAFELGDYQVAIKALRRLADTPGSGSWYQRLLGLALFRAGQGAEGLQVIERLAQAEPDNLSVRQALGEILCASPVPTEATRGLALLEQLGKEHPDDGPLLLQLGTALIAAGRAQAALVPLRRYTALVPADAHGVAMYGRALTGAGRLAEALAVLGPRSEESGEILAEQGRAQLLQRPPALAAAEASLARAAALLPGDVPICSDHAAALQRVGRLAAALDESLRCAKMRPLDGALQAQVAQLLLLNGRADEAINTYRQALAGRSDGNPGWQRGLAQALLVRGLAALGAGRPAQADLAEAHRRAPGPATARALALAHLQDGKPDEAARLLRPLAEAPERDPAVLIAYGRALRDSGQGPLSLSWFKRAEEVLLRDRDPARKGLASALRREQAVALVQVKRPSEACQLLDSSEDDESRKLHGMTCLLAARAGLDGDGPVRAVLQALSSAAREAAQLTEPERLEVEVLQAVAHLRNGQPEQATKALQELERKAAAPALLALLGPGGLDELLARAALRAGLLQQGSQHAARAIPKLPPERAQLLQGCLAAAYVSRAMAAYERGEPDRAYALLKVPGPQEPTRQALLNYDLGAVQLLRGKREEALQIFNKLDPKDVPEKWVAIGVCYDSQGDRRSAVENYRRYLLAAPTGPTADKVRRWIEVIGRFYSTGSAGAASGPGGAAPLVGEPVVDRDAAAGAAKPSVAARRNPKAHAERDARAGAAR